MTEPNRIRLNIVSEVALEAGNPRPIHMFRPGTFVDMSGRETTFSQDDVTTIVARFNANRRRKPPITERHDFGRAIGRLQDIWADTSGNLYGMPKWNQEGRKLLEDEIYDGFSCELEPTDNGWALIGGSLTNYPAVGGLEPVTLAAPPITPVPTMGTVEETQTENSPTVSLPSATIEPIPSLNTAPSAPLSQARIQDKQHSITQEFNTMSDDTNETEQAPPVTLPPIQVPSFNAADPAVTAQVNAVVQQMTAQFEAQRQLVLEQAQAQFQRQLAEMQAQQQIQQYAQDRTTATLNRQQALPVEASALVSFLSSLNSTQRTAAQSLFDRILEAGLVDFSEIGSEQAGDARNEREQYQALVDAEEKAGKTRLEAIKHVNRTYPELYQAQRVAKGGR